MRRQRKFFLVSSSRGSVLVLSLWTILALAFLAVALAQGARQKLLIYSRLDSKEQCRLLTESLIKKVSADLSHPQASLMRALASQEGATEEFSEGRFVATFKIEDENKKINLNTASVEILTRLFELGGRLDERAAKRLAAAVVDFRDSDDNMGDGEIAVSEEGDYRQAGLSTQPKNGAFEYTGELMSVAGMTKEIYNLTEKYITIYGDGKINFNTCEKETMKMTGLLPDVCEKVAQSRNRLGGESSGAPIGFTDAGAIEGVVTGFYSLTDEEKESLHSVVEQGLVGVTSDYFKIKSGAHRKGEKNSIHSVCVLGIHDGIRFWEER